MPEIAPTTEIWITLEETPRRLIVKGRSLMDKDSLVAYAEHSDEKPLWILDGYGRTDRCPVFGLGKNIYASKVSV